MHSLWCTELYRLSIANMVGLILISFIVIVTLIKSNHYLSFEIQSFGFHTV